MEILRLLRKNWVYVTIFAVIKVPKNSLDQVNVIKKHL